MHPSTRFVRGEIVYWRSQNNQEHQGVVIRQYDDAVLGAWCLVRGKLAYPQVIKTERLNRPCSGAPTLCGPGMLA